MTINQLYIKFRNEPPDRTLAKDLVLPVKVTYVPQEPLQGKYIILEDDTGKLEAVASTKNIFNILRSKIGYVINIKGRLDKTEFGNIAFEIEEIIS